MAKPSYPSYQHGDCNESPILRTPCRPVGLRRKRASLRDTSLPLLETCQMQSESGTSFTSPVTSRQFVMHAPDDNKDAQNTKKYTSEMKTVASDEKVKRKSSPLLECHSFKKKFTSRSVIAPFQNDKSKEGTLNKNSTSPLIECKETALPIATVTAIDQIDGHTNNCKVICNVESKEAHVSVKDIEALKERVARKEKRLRELELAALYNKKHDFKQVEEEIDCWLQACKEALNDLQSELANRGQACSLSRLLEIMGIPPTLIGMDQDDLE